MISMNKYMDGFQANTKVGAFFVSSAPILAEDSCTFLVECQMLWAANTSIMVWIFSSVS